MIKTSFITTLVLVLFSACSQPEKSETKLVRADSISVEEPVFSGDTVHSGNKILCVFHGRANYHRLQVERDSTGKLLSILYKNGRECSRRELDTKYLNFFTHIDSTSTCLYPQNLGVDDLFVIHIGDTVSPPDPNGESSEDISREDFHLLLGRSGDTCIKDLLIKSHFGFFYEDGQEYSYEYTYRENRDIVFPGLKDSIDKQLIVKTKRFSQVDRDRTDSCISGFTSNKTYTFKNLAFSEVKKPDKFYTTKEDSEPVYYSPSPCAPTEIDKLKPGKKYLILEEENSIKNSRDFDQKRSGKWLRIKYNGEHTDEGYVFIEK